MRAHVAFGGIRMHSPCHGRLRQVWPPARPRVRRAFAWPAGAGVASARSRFQAGRSALVRRGDGGIRGGRRAAAGGGESDQLAVLTHRTTRPGGLPLTPRLSSCATPPGPPAEGGGSHPPGRGGSHSPGESQRGDQQQNAAENHRHKVQTETAASTNPRGESQPGDKQHLTHFRIRPKLSFVRNAPKPSGMLCPAIWIVNSRATKFLA